MSQNGFYNNTLRTKAEPPEYFAEQMRRRPRRQRVTALLLVLLAPCLLAWGFIDMPRANAVATVVAQDLASSPSPTLRVTFVLDRTPSEVVVAVDGRSAQEVAALYPIGSTLPVHGVPADAYEVASAVIPSDHPAAGPVLAVLALLGAGVLWLVARGNDRKLEEAWRRKAPWKLHHG